MQKERRTPTIDEMRLWKYKRVYARARCVCCNVETRRRRFEQSVSHRESYARRAKDWTDPNPLQPYRRCYLCAWRIWCLRIGCDIFDVNRIEAPLKPSPRERCAV